MTRPWIGACALVLALAPAGCGSEPRLSGSSAAGLHRDVAAVRAATRAGDREAAVAALGRLAAEVERADQSGQLGDDDASTLRTGIRRVRSRLEQDLAAPTPSPTPAPTAQPTPPPAKEKGHGKEGKGKKHGKGGEEGD
jgi:hypothetical protein